MKNRKGYMKAYLHSNGRLDIRAESGCEAYALRKWCEENNLVPLRKTKNNTHFTGLSKKLFVNVSELSVREKNRQKKNTQKAPEAGSPAEQMA